MTKKMNVCGVTIAHSLRNELHRIFWFRMLTKKLKFEKIRKRQTLHFEFYFYNFHFEKGKHL